MQTEGDFAPSLKSSNQRKIKKGGVLIHRLHSPQQQPTCGAVLLLGNRVLDLELVGGVWQAKMTLGSGTTFRSEPGR